MKKLFILFAVLGFYFGFSQCKISGPAQIQVGETLRYSAENAVLNCAGCFEWTYPDQKIFLVGDTKSNMINIKGAVPGNAVLSLTVKTPKSQQKCKKSIDVIAAEPVAISADATKCNFPVEVINEKRAGNDRVSFEPENATDSYEYRWTVYYRNGDTKVLTDKVPQFQFSNQHTIDKVELELTLNRCTQKITKTYDRNFWYFF
ncbi:hypothetical protein [Kaistella palustris]|uniref:hypothetical protein n=1 Tax=Kaistella palustris TaxID=493376 RepID=UPI0004268300|nr:hypothetical protein [Kaistella palustris]